MSRTFPRASFRGCFLFVCCCSLVIFTYTGHDVHRRGHGRRRPLRGLSVVAAVCVEALSRRWRHPRAVEAARRRRRRDHAWRVILVKLQASRRRRRRGYFYPARTPSPRRRHRHQCGPCAPWSRASASACVNTQTVQGRSKQGRSKFEATTDATDAPRARPCSSWPSSFARSRRTHRPRPAAARADRTRRRAR